MTHAQATHGSFTLDRVFRASRQRVFDAFAKADLKARWFGGPPEAWTEKERSHDFRVGGAEIAEGQFANGMTSRYVARIAEIVDGHRIVSTYEMWVNGKHHSVSLATVEINEAKGGAQLVYTEQIVFLDGTTGEGGTQSRKTGSEGLFDRLERSLD
jgi:uncharacterized protein YndB with AHSA1/START domain